MQQHRLQFFTYIAIIIIYATIAPNIHAQEIPHIELIGKTGNINDLTFSSNEFTLAGASSENTVYLWNIHTGELIYTLTEHERYVHTVAFSPDGKILVSGSTSETEGGSIRLWNPETGKLLKTIKGHDSITYALAFHPNGKTFASGGSEPKKGLGTVKLWDTDTGKLLKTINNVHKTSVNSVAYSPNGKILASAGWDGLIQLWDANTGEYIRTLPSKYKRLVKCIVFSPDGKILASGGIQTGIIFWDTDSWEVIKQIDENENDIDTNKLAFSPNGKTLASGHNDYIILWDVNTYSKMKVLMHGEYSDIVLAFSIDGQKLATGGRYTQTRLWQLHKTRVNITPDIIEAPKTGEKFSIKIDITDGAMVSGYQVTVAFDKDKLRYVSSANGNYFTENSYFAPPVLSLGKNEITLSAASLAGEVSGDGTLATITFEVKDFNESVLKLSDIILTDTRGNQLPLYLGSAGHGTKIVKALAGISDAVISNVPPFLQPKRIDEYIVFDLYIKDGRNIVDFDFMLVDPLYTYDIVSIEKGDFFVNGVGNGDGTLATVTLKVRESAKKLHSNKTFLTQPFGIKGLLIKANGQREVANFMNHLYNLNSPDGGIHFIIPKSSSVVNVSPAPSLASPGVGKQIVFNINIKNGQNIADYQVNLLYDQTALKLIANEKSDYLINGIGNGDGDLLTTTFEVIEVKESKVHFFVYFFDTEDYVSKPTTENDRNLIVTITVLEGDVNRDGVVNILDLTIVGKHIGQITTWIKDGEQIDVNGDGVINIQDLVIVANNFS